MMRETIKKFYVILIVAGLFSTQTNLAFAQTASPASVAAIERLIAVKQQQIAVAMQELDALVYQLATHEGGLAEARENLALELEAYDNCQQVATGLMNRMGQARLQAEQLQVQMAGLATPFERSLMLEQYRNAGETRQAAITLFTRFHGRQPNRSEQDNIMIEAISIRHQIVSEAMAPLGEALVAVGGLIVEFVGNFAPGADGVDEAASVLGALTAGRRGGVGELFVSALDFVMGSVRDMAAEDIARDISDEENRIRRGEIVDPAERDALRARLRRLYAQVREMIAAYATRYENEIRPELERFQGVLRAEEQRVEGLEAQETALQSQRDEKQQQLDTLQAQLADLQLQLVAERSRLSFEQQRVQDEITRFSVNLDANLLAVDERSSAILGIPRSARLSVDGTRFRFTPRSTRNRYCAEGTPSACQRWEWRVDNNYYLRLLPGAPLRPEQVNSVPGNIFAGDFDSITALRPGTAKVRVELTGITNFDQIVSSRQTVIPEEDYNRLTRGRIRNETGDVRACKVYGFRVALQGGDPGQPSSVRSVDVFEGGGSVVLVPYIDFDCPPRV